MFCLLNIINFLIVKYRAKNLKLLCFETWHTSFPWFYLFFLFYLIPQPSLKFSLRFSLLKWKLIYVLFMFRFFLFFFLTSSFASDWKKVLFTLLTLHRIRQGTFPLTGCLRGAEYFLCSQLRLVACCYFCRQ